MTDHLLIAEETTAGTFVTPSATAASGLVNWNLTPGETKIDRRESGRSRALVARPQGTHLPSGSFEILVESDNNLVLILKALGFTSLTTSTPAEGTNSRDHVLLAEDGEAAGSLSFQVQQTRNGTTTTINVRGVRLVSLTLVVSVDDFLRLRGEFIAIEALEAGGTFGDTNSSPAAVGSITYDALEQAMRFDNMTITQGGTVAQDGTTQVVTLSGGTALADVESLEATVSLNQEQRTALGSRYATSIIKGNMDVNASLTVQNDTPTIDYFTALSDGTQEAYQFVWSGAQIESGFNVEFELTIPTCDYDDTDAYGALEAEQGARSLTIPLVGLLNATIADAAVFRIRNSTTSYS